MYLNLINKFELIKKFANIQNILIPQNYAKLNGIVCLHLSDPKFTINNELTKGYKYMLSLGL